MMSDTCHLSAVMHAVSAGFFVDRHTDRHHGGSRRHHLIEVLHRFLDRHHVSSRYVAHAALWACDALTSVLNEPLDLDSVALRTVEDEVPGCSRHSKGLYRVPLTELCWKNGKPKGGATVNGARIKRPRHARHRSSRAKTWMDCDLRDAIFPSSRARSTAVVSLPSERT